MDSLTILLALVVGFLIGSFIFGIILDHITDVSEQCTEYDDEKDRDDR